ncbi:hypothetical protein SynBIOSE41_02506 [Synechococcus sp. BIOS-E4-1]|nr:hypothetical protein SynBIOSE41_02506 [Synechococcus sp. BIOS-E4-1]
MLNPPERHGTLNDFLFFHCTPITVQHAITLNVVASSKISRWAAIQ